MKHVVTRRYSLSSDLRVLCNVKSHLRFMVLTLGFVILVRFSQTIKYVFIAEAYSSITSNISRFISRFYLCIWYCANYRDGTRSVRKPLHIHTCKHKHTYTWIIFYITANIRPCMFFFRTSLPTAFISSPIVSLFFFCTEMETQII